MPESDYSDYSDYSDNPLSDADYLALAEAADQQHAARFAAAPPTPLTQSETDPQDFFGSEEFFCSSDDEAEFLAALESAENVVTSLPEGVEWPPINSSQDQRIGPDWLPPNDEDEYNEFSNQDEGYPIEEVDFEKRMREDESTAYGIELAASADEREEDIEQLLREDESKAYGIEMATASVERETITISNSDDEVPYSVGGKIMRKRRLTNESCDLTNTEFGGLEKKRCEGADEHKIIEGDRPFVRGAFPAEVQPRAIVEGLNTKTLVKTRYIV